MPAPYTSREDIEYGAEYVLVFDGNTEPPRRVTVWNGIERDGTERMVHALRTQPHNAAQGVTYVRPRVVTRAFPAGPEVHGMQREEWQGTSPFGRAWLCEDRMMNPYNIPTERWRAAPFLHTDRKQRYATERGLDGWTLFGTEEGDAFLEQWEQQRVRD